MFGKIKDWDFGSWNSSFTLRSDDSNPHCLWINRLKINSTILNAQKFLVVQEEFGSFDTYIWQFVSREPIQNQWISLAEIPAQTKVSQSMSKDLKQRGFKFVGATIGYAFMQAVGMVNDHTVDCFRYQELPEMAVCYAVPSAAPLRMLSANLCFNLV